jgi:Ca2+/Na+ antiporter
MILETILFIIGIVTVVSSINFISKSTSNITHSLGIPEYLASTIIISIICSLPVLLIMFFSNIYDIPLLGISTMIGFALTTLTLVMGIFLIRNEVPVEYEGYRNATFMWASALVLLVSTMDRFIDRMEAIFLLMLFAFYVLYIYYRTGKSKEYVYLKTRPMNVLLYPLAIFAVVLSSFVVVGSLILFGGNLPVSINILGLVAFGLIFGLPMLNVIKNVFSSTKLTFDSIIGVVVVSLTLVPGISALILPIAYNNLFKIETYPIIFLNIVCLSFAMLTRARRSIHRKTGFALIAAFVLFVLFLFLF